MKAALALDPECGDRLRSEVPQPGEDRSRQERESVDEDIEEEHASWARRIQELE